MRGRWHIVTEGDTLTLSRGLPARVDLSVTMRCPDANRLRLATQIRQDMWRALQRLRSFRPAVAVTRDQTGLSVTAGGALDRAAPPSAEGTLADLLSNPANRRRWLTHARRQP